MQAEPHVKFVTLFPDWKLPLKDNCATVGITSLTFIVVFFGNVIQKMLYKEKICMAKYCGDYMCTWIISIQSFTT